MTKIKWILIVLLFILTVYTRFINLGWGLPYPMHPDERNIAAAIQNLRSDFNPHFFAYGQFPVYLGYLVVLVLKFFDGNLNTLVGFEEAVISLRIISSVASVINVFILMRLLRYFIPRNDKELPIISLVFVFSPALIQFSHFGTTESLLMLFYSLIIYQTLYLLHDRGGDNNILKLGLWSGLAIATKISAAVYIIFPLLVLFQSNIKLEQIIKFIFLTLFFSLIFSPYNLIAINEFASSIKYESDVALGNYVVFYTRQFVGAIPILFQLTKIFPYALGWPALVLGGLGLLGGLGWKDKKINLLRLAFLVYFIPNVFTFAKWTRFMAPVFPIIIIFAVLTLLSLRAQAKQSHLRGLLRPRQLAGPRNDIAFYVLLIISILPGVAYLSIYQNPDVRFQASEWIYKNIPADSVILSETGNVVDLPLKIQSSKLKVKNYKVISFNFYDLDKSPVLQEELGYYLSKADYIIIPSRRIFMNNPKEKYPLLNDYYQKLLSGRSGFAKVIEFNSYPKISWFGRTIFEFPDEGAEETWTVFDHPVIRIYENNIKNQI